MRQLLPFAARSRRSGLTLWEVMLALAILGGAIAVIGQLIRLGVKAAGEARSLSTAQLLCEAKVAELASGIEPLQSVTTTPFPFEMDWVYSVEVQPVDQEGLLAVRVTVEKITDQRLYPVSFSLERWIIDPTLEFEQVELEAAEDAAEAEQSAADGSSSGDASSGGASSGGTTSGGATGGGATGGGATGGRGANG